MTAAPSAPETLRGTVERVTFYNAENGYTVLRLRPTRPVPGMARDGLVTVVGNLPEIAPGEHLELGGRWTNHPRYGRQFEATTYRQVLPATAKGIVRYLGSGLVRGIGPRLAERIVAVFGEQTLAVLEHAPERLREVPGIGAKRAARLKAAWEEQKHIRQIMLFLHEHGVTTGLAVKIYKTYGDRALEVVRTDPYRLAQDIHGVGFKTADKVSRALGLPEDHPSRLQAGLYYVLQRAADEGHTFLPREALLAQAAALLEQPQEALAEALQSLLARGLVVAEEVPLAAPRLAAAARVQEEGEPYRGQGVYLPAFHTAEVGVAERLAELLTARSRLPRQALPPLPKTLTEQQAQAVRMALQRPVSVLSGGPGTGKTTTVQALIRVLETWRVPYALAAPTGRAAQRLAEATGREAATLHRLLGYKPGQGFRFHPRTPLPVDFLVVDEASMLDTLLAYHTLGALRRGAHVLFVGDADQLPSVGAGDVLRALLRHPAVPAVRLETIFRQAADSLIITNAHRINRGQMPLFPKTSRDFFLFPAEDAQAAADWVLEVVTRRIPRRFGLYAPREVQVLAPMYRGPAGVHALNARLQAALNPPAANKAEKAIFGQVFRVGDWLMQTRNNYEYDVFNGDLGVLVAIDRVQQRLVVDFNGHRVAYDWAEADQLVLAYAISVHKAQGAEFPAVVVPVVTQHYMMLQRNLLYTAVSRARRLCVLVGQKKAIALAVKNERARQRHTALQHFLQQRLEASAAAMPPPSQGQLW